jgi:hypothetical protein
MIQPPAGYPCRTAVPQAKTDQRAERVPRYSSQSPKGIICAFHAGTGQLDASSPMVRIETTEIARLHDQATQRARGRCRLALRPVTDGTITGGAAGPRVPATEQSRLSPARCWRRTTAR